MTKEALITVKGVTLTEGQSMTVRCALESFDADLAGPGLGDDEHGVGMVEAYRARVQEIRALVFKER